MAEKRKIPKEEDIIVIDSSDEEVEEAEMVKRKQIRCKIPPIVASGSAGKLFTDIRKVIKSTASPETPLVPKLPRNVQNPLPNDTLNLIDFVVHQVINEPKSSLKEPVSAETQKLIHEITVPELNRQEAFFPDNFVVYDLSLTKGRQYKAYDLVAVPPGLRVKLHKLESSRLEINKPITIGAVTYESFEERPKGEKSSGKTVPVVEVSSSSEEEEKEEENKSSLCKLYEIEEEGEKKEIIVVSDDSDDDKFKSQTQRKPKGSTLYKKKALCTTPASRPEDKCPSIWSLTSDQVKHLLLPPSLIACLDPATFEMYLRRFTAFLQANMFFTISQFSQYVIQKTFNLNMNKFQRVAEIEAQEGKSQFFLSLKRYHKKFEHEQVFSWDKIREVLTKLILWLDDKEEKEVLMCGAHLLMLRCPQDVFNEMRLAVKKLKITSFHPFYCKSRNRVDCKCFQADLIYIDWLEKMYLWIMRLKMFKSNVETLKRFWKGEPDELTYKDSLIPNPSFPLLDVSQFPSVYKTPHFLGEYPEVLQGEAGLIFFGGNLELLKA